MPEEVDDVRGEGGRRPRGGRPGSGTPATTRQTPAGGSDGAGLREAGRERDDGISAGEFLHDRLRDAEQDYCRALERCARRASPKRVHRLRTDARRLLAVLKLVNTVTAADEVPKACRAVTRQLKELGDLRDVHVQLQYLRGLRHVHPEVKPVCRALRRRECRLAVADERIRHRGRQRRRLEAVTRIVARTARSTDDETWRTAVSRSLREHADAVLAARPAVAAGPAIHRARIALRDFRFAVELAGAFARRLQPEHLEELHRCQSLMGDIHDLELMLAHIVAFGGRHPRQRARLEPLFRFFGRRRAELAREYRAAAETAFDPDRGLVGEVRRAFEDEKREAEGGMHAAPRQNQGPSEIENRESKIKNHEGPLAGARSHKDPEGPLAESGRKAPPTAQGRKRKAEGGKRSTSR